MRKLLALVALLPCAAFAQSVPNMARPVTLAGPTGLQAAMTTKADVANGTLNNPSVTNGSFSLPTISGGTASNIAINGGALSAPTITSGTQSGTAMTGVSLDGTSTMYAPTQSTLSSALLSTGVMLTPQMYGAMANGTADDTSAVQSAIAAACAFSNHTGGIVFFPPGRYMMSHVTVPCEGIKLLGSGIGNRDHTNGTVLAENSSGTAPMIYFNHATANYDEGGSVENVSLYNGGVNNTQIINGPMIEADYVRNFHVSNIYSWGAFSVVKLVGGKSAYIEHLYAEDNIAGGVGIELVGTGADTSSTGGALTRMDGPTLYDVNMEAGPPTGTFGSRHFIGIYAHGFVATLRAIHVGMLNPYIGVKVDCTIDGTNVQAGGLGECPNFFDMTDVESDFADYYNYYFTDFAHFKLRGIYAHGTDTGNGSGETFNNLRAESTHFRSYGLEVEGGKFDNAQASCLYDSVNGSRISSLFAHQCNLAGNAQGATGTAGIELAHDSFTSTDASDAVFGNVFCDPGDGVQSTMDGVLIASALDYWTVGMNTFFSCRSGGVYSGSGSHTNQTANVGP